MTLNIHSRSELQLKMLTCSLINEREDEDDDDDDVRVTVLKVYLRRTYT